MRIESRLSLVAHNSAGREVKSVSGVHALKPMTINTYDPYMAGEGRDKRSADRRDVERRKLCRRVVKQAILMELRADSDRRGLNLRDDGTFAHIDEEA